MARFAHSLPLLLIGALALGACSREPDANALAELDNSLAGNTVDPALASALEDQIMVDPRLAGPASGRNAATSGVPVVAPGPKPSVAELGALKRAPAPRATPAEVQPATLGALAAEKRKGSNGKGCMSGLAYSTGWAAKMPAELPVFPRARVSEAAGRDDGDCRARAASFATAADIGQVVDYYYTRATAAGFTAEHVLEGKEHVLGGTRESDGAAYYILARALPKGGTEVDLVANNGR